LTDAVAAHLLQILEYKNDLKALIQTMIEHCKSERGYTTTARVLAITLMTLTNTWVRDYRSVNADEWTDPGASTPPPPPPPAADLS